jgi:HTH-type transcriptional regulator/antitoxin HipB
MEVAMPIRDAKQLGAALQRERKRQGLTQTQLAEKAGLRQQTVSAVEGGKPRSELQVILDIMTALGLEISLSGRAERDDPKLEDIF